MTEYFGPQPTAPKVSKTPLELLEPRKDFPPSIIDVHGPSVAAGILTFASILFHNIFNRRPAIAGKQ